MNYVLASIVAVFTLLLAAGLISGRVKAKSCCAPSDPQNDLRMNPQDS